MPEPDPNPNHALNRLARGPRCAPDGIWDRLAPLTGRNRIAAAFYDGPSWARFRVWERVFLSFQGGARRARRQILRHLDPVESGLVLEVGIGDGENLRFTRPGWTVWGVDLARGPLLDCIQRDGSMRDRLVRAEAEALPFDDASFAACYSIGGFTYYGDHAQALREMARVTRPGGLLVVADELPHIYRYGIGRLIPRRLMEFGPRLLGVDPDFASMIFRYADDPEAAIRAAWPDATRHSIWAGLGYCYSAVRSQSPLSTRESLGGSSDAGPLHPP